jgi:hypothetical protein
MPTKLAMNRKEKVRFRKSETLMAEGDAFSLISRAAGIPLAREVKSITRKVQAIPTRSMSS